MSKNYYTPTTEEDQIPPAFGRVIPPGTEYKYKGLQWQTIKRSVIIVLCPFCGREHQHCWPPSIGPDGQLIDCRLAHCNGNSQGRQYRLQARGEK